MKIILKVLILSCSAFILVGCGSKDLNEVLTGTWNYEIQRDDDINGGTKEGTYTFYEDGTVDVEETDNGDTHVGTYSISEESFVITYNSVITYENVLAQSLPEIDVNDRLTFDAESINSETITGNSIQNIEWNKTEVYDGIFTLTKE